VIVAWGYKSSARSLSLANMSDYLRLIDTDTPGPRYDVTPLFRDYEAFMDLVRDLGRPFESVEFEVVAGIDALGFILGTALALRFQKGFIPIRKGGKLPVEVDTSHFVDYTGQEKSLELRTVAIERGTRVLVVDEWVETGAQVRAAIDLIERQGGVVIGVAAINVDDNEATRSLRERYNCHTVWQEA
jgi:adenine phosphoribosyltransferase